MRKRIIAALMVLVLFALPIDVKAFKDTPISDIYKAGIYKVESAKECNINYKITKQSGDVLVVVLNEDNVVQVLHRFTDDNDDNDEVIVRNVKKGYSFVIIGEGEVAVKYIQL